MPRPAIDRALLIDALGSVFAARGYEGATMTELSRATGLGKASLYHHFPGGKDEMLGAVVRATIDELHRQVFAHLDTHRAAPERIERMLDGFDAYVDGGRRNCVLAVIAQGSAAGEFAAGVQAQYQAWLQRMEETYREHGFGAKRAARVARQTMATLYGAIVLGRLLGEPETYPQLVKRLRKDLFG